MYAFRERNGVFQSEAAAYALLFPVKQEVEKVSATCFASRMNYSIVRKPKAIISKYLYLHSPSLWPIYGWSNGYHLLIYIYPMKSHRW